jgi:phosphoglycerate kinase (EC 2.7.2.3)
VAAVGEVRYRSLDQVEPAGRRVAVRIDLNASIDPQTGRVQPNERFRAHVVTIRELMSRGARVVLLAHQGRRGDPDFTDLSQHAEILSKLAEREIRFVPDVAGEEAVRAIKGSRGVRRYCSTTLGSLRMRM